MSNAEKEYQDELKQMDKDELLDLVHHFRELSFNLQHLLDSDRGSCKKCNTPLSTYCRYCDINHEELDTKHSGRSEAILQFPVNLSMPGAKEPSSIGNNTLITDSIIRKI